MAMRIDLFFTGYKMPFDRYRSYFPKLNHIPDPIPDEVIRQITSNDPAAINIMTHSVGLVKALIFCMINEIKPTIILAIDPPCISEEEIVKKLDDNDLPQDLKNIYDSYIRLINEKMFPWIPICLYRNMKNKDYSDSRYYNELNYYPSDTHYPYMVKKARDQILRLYEKNKNLKLSVTI